MKTKLCTKCKVEKEVGEFHKHKGMKDGLACWCKVCANKNSKEHYKINRESKIKYQKGYSLANQESIRKFQKEYREKNKEKIKRYKKQYNQSEEGKEVNRKQHEVYCKTETGKEICRKSSEKWNNLNPEKIKTIRKANHAIEGGKLIRQPCEICGATEHIHKHHDNYSKPLDVRWLCPKHHKEHHL